MSIGFLILKIAREMSIYYTTVFRKMEAIIFFNNYPFLPYT